MNEKLKVPQATKKGWIYCKVGGCFDSAYTTSKFRRGRVQHDGDVSPTIMSGDTQICIFLGYEEL